MDLRDLGFLYHQWGKYEQASQFYENSLAVCEAHGIDPFESLLVSARLALAILNPYLQTAHEQLGEVRFAALAKKGRSMSIEEAVGGLANHAG